MPHSTDSREQKNKWNAYMRQYRGTLTPEQKASNHGKIMEWRRRNKERHAESVRKWQKANPDRMKLRRRKDVFNKYGITAETFDSLLKTQGGKCAICQTESPGGKHNQWHIDHCHNSGMLRGILCNACNCGLGRFKDSADLVEKAATYLRVNIATVVK
jgi:hypothetical protein